MTSIDQLLGEFADAWTAGSQPDIRDYLARAQPDERDELAATITEWLALAPTPDYDADTLTAFQADPAFVAALDAADASLGQRMPGLRERAGLALDDVARRLAALFDLADPARAAEYLRRLEDDDLDERRLSRRLLDGLAAILGADPDALRPAPMATAASALFRADAAAAPAQEQVALDLDALSRAALSPAPAPDLDETDRLFLGGPGA